uniref:Protein HEXIM1 n=1 Tax=Rhabditophanes sp. KR3021 TaxID=114890 RepID=A0AC35TRJ7_9BILA
MKSLDHHTSKGIGGSLSENDAEDVDAVFKQSKKTYLNGKQRRIHKIIKHNRSRPYLAPTRKRASDNNKKREQGSSEARGISDNEMDESNTMYVYLIKKPLIPSSSFSSSLLLAPWAPRNTNQFLCQDMEARVNKDNEAEQGTNSYRTRCFSLNVVNVSSSSLDDSTSEETMSDSEYNDTYEFDREYEEVCKDRLEALSKAEVTQEFIAMERKQMTLNEDVDNLVEENHLLKQLLNKNGISFSEVVAAEKRHTRSHSHSSDSASYVSESNDMEELENLLVESNTSTTSDTPLSKSQVAV